MAFNTRAARAQQWKPTYTFEFEYQPREDPISARRGKRGSCQFASATASLSEGVMSKPNVSFSPPSPKPKVSLMSWAVSSIQHRCGSKSTFPSLDTCYVLTRIPPLQEAKISILSPTRRRGSLHVAVTQ